MLTFYKSYIYNCFVNFYKSYIMIKLETIKKSDFNDIAKLTSIKEIMQYVGNNKTWDARQVANFIKYCGIEEKQDDHKREQYYYKIVDDKKNLVGIIGFHIFQKNKDYYLSVYINPKYQGKGYFSMALSQLLERVAIHKPQVSYIISLVYDKNDKMNAISKKKFECISKVKINGKKMNKYSIEVETNRTYLIKSEYLDMKTIKLLFEERGNWSEYDEKNSLIQPTILYVDGKYIQDRRLWKYKPKIKNLINDEKYMITYKNNLYNTLKNDKNIKQFLLPQINLTISNSKLLSSFTKFSKIFNNSNNSNYVWALKPILGFAGKGIFFLNNYRDFINIIEKKISKSNSNKSNSKKANNRISYKKISSKKKSRKKTNEWILQQYIKTPLLYEGKKFHMRVFFIYHKKLDTKFKKIVKNGYILDTACIYTAKKKYKKGEYNNKEIHDTHKKSTPIPIYFPRDFKTKFGNEKTLKVESDLKNLFKNILQNIKINFFKENKYCYEVFGCDIMLTSSFKIKLIEINDKVGYATYKNDKIDINKILFRGIMEEVIDKLYKPKNKIKYYNNMIKLN